MSKDIYSLQSIDILPANINSDVVQAKVLSETLFRHRQILNDNIEKVRILVENADGDLLDMLAWQCHVDFYDDTLPLETRRQLIRNSIKWHMKKGTVAAVEELIETVFGYGRVDEWFNYEGKPYHFKIATACNTTNKEDVLYFYKVLNSIKRKSAWLEQIINVVEAGNRIIYLSAVNVITHNIITIKSETTSQFQLQNVINLGTLMMVHNKYKISMV